MQSDTMKRCDIIIPVWNQLELTEKCIDSIEKHTSYPYRLVIIDNASDVFTRQYLDNLKKQSPKKVVIIRNKKNVGFVQAANQGMIFSDAPYSCIMNNDTIATDGWLKEMIAILEENKNIGIINPASNTSCQYPGKLDIDAFAATLKKMKGRYQELYTCRAFSMVVKKEVVQKIGYLDDIYGMGYFDDTDYCKRAQALGYKTVLARASYVYHKGSQSFAKIKEKNQIFLENEKKFVSKWGKQLRIVYALPNFKSQYEINEISCTINKIAADGHQIWIFTKAGLRPKLNLIDHESIRFYLYPTIFFNFTIFYKIWKRKKKKKLHIVITNRSYMFNIFNFFKNVLDSCIFIQKDFDLIEKKIKRLSYPESVR